MDETPRTHKAECPRCGKWNLVKVGNVDAAEPPQEPAPTVDELWQCLDCAQMFIKGPKAK